MTRGGLFAPAQFTSMVFALIFALVAMFLPSKAGTPWGEGVLVGLLGASLALYSGLSLWSFPPILYGKDSAYFFKAWLLFSGIMAVFAGMAVLAGVYATRSLFGAILVCFVILGAWVVRASPAPMIDVWAAHQASCQAICEGANPFAISYPDVYGSGLNAKLIDQSAIKGDMVQAGYPYPPMTLMMSFPGYLWGDDHRYSNLCAIVLTALVLGFIGQKRLGMLLGLLLLLMPYMLFVLEQGWTEVHILLLLAAFTLCALRAPKVAPWLLGLFLVSKQQLPMVAPLALLVIPKPLKFKDTFLYCSKALLAGALVTLPWVLADPAAFDHSVLGVFHAAPEKMMLPRADSVTFFAAMRYYNLGELPPISHFVAAGLALLLCLWANWKSQAPVSACVASIGLVNLAMFAFSHHAFANHYYLIFGAFLCATAALSREIDRGGLPIEQR
jgi:hypothetical protein